MPLSRRLLSLTALTIALAGVALPAAAQQGRGQRGERPPVEPLRPPQSDTLSDAVRRIERSNRGQVLSAERMQYEGRDVNRIKVVDNEGRVRIYMDDAAPGTEPRRTSERDNEGARTRHRRDD